MLSTRSNSKIRRFGESGHLYILLATGIWISYCLSRNVGIYDWHKELAYFDYIKDSLVSFQTWPLFWWQKLPELSRYPAVVYTSSFISNPETLLFSPLIVFLKSFDVITCIKLIALSHYLVGLAGAMVLRRRLQWNTLQFRVYLVLFLLSPIIMQHLAIGYTPWLNLFFFPWVIYFLIDHRILPGALGLAAILALILLQGGVHVFWWFGALTVLFSFFSAVVRREWLPLVKLSLIVAGSIALSYIRLYASAQSYTGFQQDFVNGYQLSNFLTWALLPTVLLSPAYTLFVRYNWAGVPSWDGGIFWGLALIMIVLLLLKYHTFRQIQSSAEIDPHTRRFYDALLFSSLFLFILSFFSIYQLLVQAVIAIIPIPFLAGVEKYPFRFAIPAFLGLSVLLANYSSEIWKIFDRWLEAMRQIKIFPARLRERGQRQSVPVSRHIWYEILLAGPLLFATMMWLMLALANPSDAYPVQNVAPPEIVLSPAESNQSPSVSVTPDRLILHPLSPALGNVTYILAGIPAADRKLLDVISGNAVLSETQGSLAIVPENQAPVVVKFRSVNYESSLVLTAVAWIGLLVFGSAYFLHRKMQHARRI